MQNKYIQFCSRLDKMQHIYIYIYIYILCMYYIYMLHIYIYYIYRLVKEKTFLKNILATAFYIYIYLLQSSDK